MGQRRQAIRAAFPRCGAHDSANVSVPRGGLAPQGKPMHWVTLEVGNSQISAPAPSFWRVRAGGFERLWVTLLLYTGRASACLMHRSCKRQSNYQETHLQSSRRAGKRKNEHELLHSASRTHSGAPRGRPARRAIARKPKADEPHAHHQPSRGFRHASYGHLRNWRRKIDAEVGISARGLIDNPDSISPRS